MQSPMGMEHVGVQEDSAVQSHDQTAGIVVESDVIEVNHEVSQLQGYQDSTLLSANTCGYHSSYIDTDRDVDGRMDG